MSTIFALSTVPGKSAVAVVRLSGPLSGPILKTLTRTKVLTPRLASVRQLLHPATSEVLDRGITVFFQGPRTFTGEDVAELHLHGGKAVIESVLDAIPSTLPFLQLNPQDEFVNTPSTYYQTIRLAEPGEFSKRAFYNGKLDLTQAEGLADLINAETDEQRRSAHRQASGVLSRLYDGWRADLIESRSLYEAIIDFGEDNDDIDGETAIKKQVMEGVLRMRDALKRHLEDSSRGELLRTGIKVAIFGPPNAGKSSLLNILAKRDVSIVSSEAGTTRDVIEKGLDIGGFPVIISDTAGLRDGLDVGEVEREGVKRARERVREANYRICVLPKGEAIDAATQRELHLCREIDPDLESLILIVNKADREGDSERVKMATTCGVSESKTFEVSCLDNAGMTGFVEAFVLELRRLTSAGTGQESLGTSARHRQQVRKCLDHLSAYITDGGRDVVLGAEELRYASDALGRVTGKIDVEEILGKIFSTFCIGK